MIKFFSMVVIIGFSVQAFSKPAAFQLLTVTSPILGYWDRWPVPAIKITSGLGLLYSAELTITAGRFLLVVWSVKGNGTRTTSPNL